jgi:hypothetical protein
MLLYRARDASPPRGDANKEVLVNQPMVAPIGDQQEPPTLQGGSRDRELFKLFGRLDLCQLEKS